MFKEDQTPPKIFKFEAMPFPHEQTQAANHFFLFVFFFTTIMLYVKNKTRSLLLSKSVFTLLTIDNIVNICLQFYFLHFHLFFCHNFHFQFFFFGPTQVKSVDQRSNGKVFCKTKILHRNKTRKEKGTGV